MNKKILIASVFATLMLTVPTTSVVGVNSDRNDDSKENYEIDTLDDYEEIITFIEGTCNNVTFKGIYIKRDVTLHGGENTGLEISGYYRPWNYFNEIDVIYIHVPIYIGIIFSYPSGMTCSILGFAFGDIEWHK
jgi:hypothetical protein